MQITVFLISFGSYIPYISSHLANFLDSSKLFITS